MPSVTEQQLTGWLLPGNAKVTEWLVRSSGLARLAEFTQLSTYLAARPGFEAFRPEAVATLEQFDEEPSGDPVPAPRVADLPRLVEPVRTSRGIHA